MEIKQIFGKNLKKYRKAAGYTQMQLSEILNVEQKHISFIESGNSFPSATLISKISEVFKIPPKNLFDFEETLSIEDLKSDIVIMLGKLDYEKISKVHNYVSYLNTGT